MSSVISAERTCTTNISSLLSTYAMPSGKDLGRERMFVPTYMKWKVRNGLNDAPHVYQAKRSRADSLHSVSCLPASNTSLRLHVALHRGHCIMKLLHCERGRRLAFDCSRVPLCRRDLARSRQDASDIDCWWCEGFYFHLLHLVLHHLFCSPSLACPIPP